MSKYCTGHPTRIRSHYPARLAARGLSKSPRMESLDALRKRQEARTERTGFPWRTYASEDDEA